MKRMVAAGLVALSLSLSVVLAQDKGCDTTYGSYWAYTWWPPFITNCEWRYTLCTDGSYYYYDSCTGGGAWLY